MPKNNQIQIGVVVPPSIGFGRQIIRGVQQWCFQCGNARMILLTDLESLSPSPQRLDGIVLMSAKKEELTRLNKEHPNLVVTSNRTPVKGYPQIINDDTSIGQMAADYLLSRGHRQLVFLGPDHLLFSQLRWESFSTRVHEAGLTAEYFHARNLLDLPDICKSLLARKEKVALFAASDLHARWLIESLPDPKATVPGHLAVLGVDNDSLENALCPVPLSSIALSGEKIGFEAASLIARRTRKAKAKVDTPSGPVLIPPKRVISRNSTDALAVSDRLVARTMQMIRERMNEFQDVGDLIDAVGVPRRTLEVRYRKATGRTLAEDLTRNRIEHSRKLLADTQLSIAEISDLVGFSEPRMLTLVFRRVTGESPTEYRKRVQI